ncbi:cyclin-h1-1-like protein [Trifolium pratense]|uniref:Cyclin-h1-1-like protein n=1 Tax=Trifolium pratense TaxID=57577 RepID=A0A2K3P989_TRIPR|nr:cyclin-h1-1-like protein [Trifolium pratense]
MTNSSMRCGFSPSPQQTSSAASPLPFYAPPVSALSAPPHCIFCPLPPHHTEILNSEALTVAKRLRHCRCIYCEVLLRVCMHQKLKLLVEKYTDANQRAKQTLEQCGATLMEVDADGSLSYPESQTTANNSGEKHSRIKPLSIEEEQCIKVFYENKLQEVCNNFHFPHKIQSLEFDLIVYAPYRSVEGFTDYMEEFCNAGEDELQMLKALQNTARLEVDKVMLTDAPLLFPPGQLALAALRTSNALHKVLDFDSFLSRIFSHQNSTHTMAELLESLDAIDSWVRKYRSPSEKELKHINRKLKSCWGQSSHDEGKKREKKSKHKSRKSSNEAQNA